MRFVVTGTGRSGTGYTAHLFDAAGLRCGHEQVFRDRPALGERGTPRPGLVGTIKSPVARVRETIHRQRTTLDGDASWMAAPRLKAFRGVSFLQTRHPLLVIRSFVGTQFFSATGQHRRQRAFAAAFFSPTGDDVLDTMRWWVFWNDLAAEYATVVYRLEDLNVDLFARMLERLDVPDAATRSAEAFAAVPTDVNSSARRGDQRGAISWADLPSGEAKVRLEDAMKRYGYADHDV